MDALRLEFARILLEDGSLLLTEAGDAFLDESSGLLVTDRYELEDGSGVLLKEITDVDGAVAESQTAQSAAAIGAERLTGTAADIQPVQVSALVGAERLSGIVAETQAGQSEALAGSERLTATSAGQQTSQTSAVVGSLREDGLVAEEQAAQTAASLGALRLDAATAQTQTEQEESVDGDVEESAGVAQTQAVQASEAAGALRLDARVTSTSSAQTEAIAANQLVAFEAAVQSIQAAQRSTALGSQLGVVLAGHGRSKRQRAPQITIPNSPLFLASQVEAIQAAQGSVAQSGPGIAAITAGAQDPQFESAIGALRLGVVAVKTAQRAQRDALTAKLALGAAVIQRKSRQITAGKGRFRLEAEANGRQVAQASQSSARNGPLLARSVSAQKAQASGAHAEPFHPSLSDDELLLVTALLAA